MFTDHNDTPSAFIGELERNKTNTPANDRTLRRKQQVNPRGQVSGNGSHLLDFHFYSFGKSFEIADGVMRSLVETFE